MSIRKRNCCSQIFKVQITNAFRDTVSRKSNSKMRFSIFEATSTINGAVNSVCWPRCKCLMTRWRFNGVKVGPVRPLESKKYFLGPVDSSPGAFVTLLWRFLCWKTIRRHWQDSLTLKPQEFKFVWREADLKIKEEFYFWNEFTSFLLD